MPLRRQCQVYLLPMMLLIQFIVKRLLQQVLGVWLH